MTEHRMFDGDPNHSTALAARIDSSAGLYDHPYAWLGVRTFINCTGFRAATGNSIMNPATVRAMEAAAGTFVNLNELMDAAGRYLAHLTGAPSAIVTTGSAGSLTLAAAACAAGNDPEKMLMLPEHGGKRPTVIVPADQRFAYEQSLRVAGCEIATATDKQQLVARLDSGAILVCLIGRSEEKSELSLDRISPICHRYGVPILVDAAALPPRRPDPWLKRGANLVAYSGGKMLRGPHSTGLLLGDRNLVQAAWLNGAPQQSFGRALKVSKEEIVGLVCAVSTWFEEDSEQSLVRDWVKRLEEMQRIIEIQPGVAARIVQVGAPDIVSYLNVSWKASAYPISPDRLRRAMAKGSPRIILDDINVGDHSIAVYPINMRDGQGQVVADRLLQTLRDAAAGSREKSGEDQRASQPSSCQVHGNWRLTAEFLVGRAEHRLELHQQGREINGLHTAPSSCGHIEGFIDEDEISLRSALPFMGTALHYHFRGTLRNGTLMGTVALGCARPEHDGESFKSQFGEADWHAERI